MCTFTAPTKQPFCRNSELYATKSTLFGLSLGFKVRSTKCLFFADTFFPLFLLGFRPRANLSMHSVIKIKLILNDNCFNTVERLTEFEDCDLVQKIR